MTYSSTRPWHAVGTNNFPRQLKENKRILALMFRSIVEFGLFVCDVMASVFWVNRCLYLFYIYSDNRPR